MSAETKSRGPNKWMLAILCLLACAFLCIAVVTGLMTTNPFVTKKPFGDGTPFGSEGPFGSAGSSSDTPDSEVPGAVIVDVPWKHLHHIDAFEMTNQDGEKFNTAQFSGKKPFLVGFFFASCPSICRDFNKQLERLNEQLKKEDVAFVTITVDPENDTPEKLKEYAKGFGAQSPRWTYLTDQKYKLKQVGEQMFRVEVIDKANHTDNIMLVDKWGKFRDRFKWDDPYDMKRLVKVVKQVAAETEPPLNAIVPTRNAMVGRAPFDLSTVAFLREYHLYTSDKQPFFSRDLGGEVWITNFFFTSCPTICKEQTKYLQGLQNRLGDDTTKLVSITTDPQVDIPEKLSEYARAHDADPEKWLFLTGNEKVIPRVAAEFYSAMGGEGHHSTELFVVDKWGNVRGRFNWQDAAQEVEMLSLIDNLWSETRPPAEFVRINGSKKEESTREEQDDE